MYIIVVIFLVFSDHKQVEIISTKAMCYVRLHLRCCCSCGIRFSDDDVTSCNGSTVLCQLRSDYRSIHVRRMAWLFFLRHRRLSRLWCSEITLIYRR